MSYCVYIIHPHGEEVNNYFVNFFEVDPPLPGERLPHRAVRNLQHPDNDIGQFPISE